MFLAVYASRLVEFDFTRRNTRFIAHCSQCGQYESVVGAIPVYLKGGEIGEREFARTDLQFGTGDEKHPHLLCGESAANALKRARLRGVDLIAIDRGDV
jgi:hypothetical protein